MSDFLDRLFPRLVRQREYRAEYRAEICPYNSGSPHEVEEEIAPDPMCASGILSRFSCIYCGKEVP